VSFKTWPKQSLRTTSEEEQQIEVLRVNQNLLVAEIKIFVVLALIFNLLYL